jgi:hypothetical protein
MILFRNIVLGIIITVILMVLLLLSPRSNAYIVSKVVSFYLDKPLIFNPAKITSNHYDINTTIQGDLLAIHLNYTILSNITATLNFQGDVSIFSEIANTTLPHILVDLNASYNKLIYADATLLDGTLHAHFNPDDLSYTATATDLNISSYLKQQKLKNYAKGTLTLTSQGNFKEGSQLTATVKKQKLYLLRPSLKLLKNSTDSQISVDIDATLALDDNKLKGALNFDSSLATLCVNQLYYHLGRGDFHANLNVHNRIKAYSTLKQLQATVSATYAKEQLLGTIALNANGYALDLDHFSYADAILKTEYRLHSKHQEIVDISKNHALNGVLTYAKQRLDATLTSSYLDDTVSIELYNSILHVNSDKLSLDGILKHLKLPPSVSASLKLSAEANLTSPTQWRATLKSNNLFLSKKLADSLNLHTPATLDLDLFNQEKTIVIQPQLKSSLFSLHDSRVVYDINHSVLHVNSHFKDLNISLYHAPKLTLISDVEFSNTLKTTTHITSPFETIHAKITQNKETIQGDVDFHLTQLNRFNSAKSLKHIKGNLKFTDTTKGVTFSSYLTDINTTFYTHQHAKIMGELKHTTPLQSHIEFVTSDEKLGLDLTSDANQSRADFTYSIKALDRFAPLNPDYTVAGNGTLKLNKEHLDVTLTQKHFGDIVMTKVEDNITLKAAALPLKELFILTKQKPLLQGDIALHSTITPKHLVATIDSKKICSNDENLSLRATPLHLKLKLDSADTQYEGSLHIKTAKEQLHLKKFTVATTPLQITAPFALSSDDLSQGVVLLPQEFNGSLQASGTLSYSNDKLHVDAVADNRDFTLEPFHADVNLKKALLQTDMSLKTQLWQKNSDINLRVHYAEPLTLNGAITTQFEQLHFDNIIIDTKEKKAKGTYELRLYQTPKSAALHHGTATFYGSLSDLPQQQATLISDSFGGRITVKATETNLTIVSNGLDVDDVTKFLELNSSIKSGTADVDIWLGDRNLLDFNTTTLQGEISIDAENLELYGVDADADIDKLRNFNDINIFEGNFPGKGIVTSLLNAPSNMMSSHSIPISLIPHFRVDGYIKNGKFYCYDCALSTQKNRIAAKGVVDLNTTNFHYFQIGLLRDDGCPFFIQDILGSVKKPDIELSKTSLSLLTGTVKSVGTVAKGTLNLGTKIIRKMGSLTGNIIDGTTENIPGVKQAGGVVSNTLNGVTNAPNKTNTYLSKECTPFYRGMVRHPKKQTRLYQTEMLSN